MNFWDILAGVLSVLISIALWLAAINEICKEMYPERDKPAIPCKALVTHALRRRQQQQDDAVLRRKHSSV